MPKGDGKFSSPALSSHSLISNCAGVTTKVRFKIYTCKFDSYPANFVIWVVTETLRNYDAAGWLDCWWEVGKGEEAFLFVVFFFAALWFLINANYVTLSLIQVKLEAQVRTGDERRENRAKCAIPTAHNAS